MNSRKISLEILEMILKGKSFNDSVEENLNFKKASKLDQSFISMLLLTYMRRNGEIEQIIRNTIKKPLKKSQFKVLNIIRMSITQILFLDTSDWASVNTAVELTKDEIPGLKSLVNGVLRNICKNRDTITKNSETILNIPNWIVSSLRNHYNISLIKEISREILYRPYLDIKIRKNEFTIKNWGKVLEGKIIFGETVRVKKLVNVKELPFFNEGLWWVQGLSSSIPVMLIEKYFKRNFSKVKVLEVGSAPGGKTIQLCDLGFKVTAIDKSKIRMKTLEKNLKRMKLFPSALCTEVAQLPNDKNFSCVLIDAPCSASGLIKRKPEILLQKEKSLKTMIFKQSAILEKAAKHLIPGGILIYSVCSILYEEGEKQMISFLENNTNFSQVKLDQSTFVGLDCSVRNGYINTSPLNYKKEGGVDGFFIGCLKKNS